jgi:hypothetical protein
LQTAWLAENKGKSWEANFLHAAVYTSVIFLAARIDGVTLSIAAVAVIFGSHFLIDPLKAKWGIIKSIWLDQILHLAVFVLVWRFMT